ncbi:MAG: GNAT family N-acetyltransferase [Actinobacteria bacterium]|nr:GNAT family N-acetyltransferase [Actinomycetota bacterium]
MITSPVVSIGPVSLWTDEQVVEYRELTEAVYPPRTAADWPGRKLEWSQAEMGVRVVDPSGWLVSYVGVLTREGTLDTAPVTIGGIGGVKTHPDARGLGYAALGMRRATEWFHEQHGVDFGLLVCEPGLISYYENLGWVMFDGVLLTTQGAATVEFTFNRVMTQTIGRPAPVTGIIDLSGPPW